MKNFVFQEIEILVYMYTKSMVPWLKSKKNRGKIILNQEEQKRGIKSAYEEAFTKEENNTAENPIQDRKNLTHEQGSSQHHGREGPKSHQSARQEGTAILQQRWHSRGGKPSKDNRGGEGQQAKKQKASLHEILSNSPNSS